MTFSVCELTHQEKPSCGGLVPQAREGLLLIDGGHQCSPGARILAATLGPIKSSIKFSATGSRLTAGLGCKELDTVWMSLKHSSGPVACIGPEANTDARWLLAPYGITATGRPFIGSLDACGLSPPESCLT